MAICAKFHQYCKEKHIDLPAKGNFTLAYDTNIPRQVSKQLHRGACVRRRNAAGKLDMKAVVEAEPHVRDCLNNMHGDCQCNRKKQKWVVQLQRLVRCIHVSNFPVCGECCLISRIYRRHGAKSNRSKCSCFNTTAPSYSGWFVGFQCYHLCHPELLDGILRSQAPYSSGGPSEYYIECGDRPWHHCRIARSGYSGMWATAGQNGRYKRVLHNYRVV
jgi:hypothetical protein